VIRRALPPDAGEVAEVFLASRRDGLPYLPELHTDAETQQWIARLIHDAEVWVAELEGRIAGLMVLDGEHLDQLYVAPGAQGGGVGSRLVELAKLRSPRRLLLWAFQRNQRARAFYERRGFVTVELTNGSANEEREPDVLYEWRPEENKL
jgi:GNAT superfamily N-acetyltransferase